MGICFFTNQELAICPVGDCRADWVAETPVLKRGFAGGYGFQGAVGHFGLLLVCRFFATLRMTTGIAGQAGNDAYVRGIAGQAGNDTSGRQ